MQDWRRKWSFFENKMFHQNKVKKFFKTSTPKVLLHKILCEYHEKIEDNSYYCQNNFYSFLQKGNRITLRYSKKVLSLQTYDFKFRHLLVSECFALVLYAQSRLNKKFRVTSIFPKEWKFWKRIQQIRDLNGMD